MDLRERVSAEFQTHFGEKATVVVRAPGRVNLIGEHTDYNDGFVMPLAINRAVYIALHPRTDRRVVVHSLDMGDSAEFDLDNIEHTSGWQEYIHGTAAIAQQRGHSLNGWEGVMAGDVPIGSGLSSSAALELAALQAFHAVSDFAWDAKEMALTAQSAEVDWLGVKIGIMDQYISAAATAGHATLIDCRTLATTAIPMPPGVAVVILDTTTRRGLVDSEYNERFATCKAAAAHFEVTHLRDLPLATFMARAEELDDRTRRRVRHVLTENERVQSAVRAMKSADAVTLGAILNDGHHSLRDDYEVSSPALDAIVTAAQNHHACFGARMSGAGFGGCAVALVSDAAVTSFVESVATEYERGTGHTAAIYVTDATAGAERLD